jgi:hypothetical protein
VGYCDRGDEHSGSSATELVHLIALRYIALNNVTTNSNTWDPFWKPPVQPL